MTWLYVPSMESPCAPESPCSTKACEPHSDYTGADIEPFATLNGKLLPPLNLSRSWKRYAWMRRLSGLTSPRSTVARGAAEWIASLPVFHASRTASPASAKGLRTSDGSGPTSFGSFATLDLSTSSWRTSQGSLLPEDSQPASPTLPNSVSMRSAQLFQRKPLALRTSASASSSWHTPHGMAGMDSKTGRAGGGGEFALQAHNWAAQWDTPTAGDSRRGSTSKRTRGTPHFTAQAAGWPTPMAADWRGSAGVDKAELPNATMNWPTPSARDHKSEKGGVATMDHFNRPSGPTLSAFIEHTASLLPALTIPDGQTCSQTDPSSRRRLNPVFGCWLMGMPWFWTNPGITSSVRLETESWRYALESQLRSFCGEADGAE